MTELTSPNGSHVATEDERWCVSAWRELRVVYERVTAALADELARECGITLNEYDVLLFVSRTEPGLPRIGDLNAAVTLSQPALSRLVMRLEHQGLMRRIDADDDRRAVRVSLTDSGRALLEKAAPIHTECVRRHLNGHMTEGEHAALTATFAQIEANQK